jgi:general stress protein 26
MTTDADAKRKLDELIKDAKVAMLATRGPDGRLHSRPMMTGDATFDGTLRFFTDIRSGKSGDLLDDEDVLVTYADERGGNYVSLNGRGRIVRDSDRVRALWSERARPWFPDGPDDPALGLIEVVVDSAEYWDERSRTMAALYGYARAAVGAKPSEPEVEHRRVGFRH